jgi:hypothetical protein
MHSHVVVQLLFFVVSVTNKFLDCALHSRVAGRTLAPQDESDEMDVKKYEPDDYWEEEHPLVELTWEKVVPGNCVDDL